MAVETPLSAGQKILDKYLEILNTLFVRIFESITGPDAENQDDRTDKYIDKQKEIEKLITDDFKGDKDQFVKHIQQTIYPATQVKLQERLPFE